MTRILYQDGKLLLSLTKDEIKQAQENIGRPIELPIGQLKVFQEDIHKAAMAHWSKVEVHKTLEEHQLSYNRKSKNKK
tara:strand:+ start:291 stop:524 length:234 start_codon:yes stop_codon:yes gene_type:complete